MLIKTSIRIFLDLYKLILKSHMEETRPKNGQNGFEENKKQRLTLPVLKNYYKSLT